MNDGTDFDNEMMNTLFRNIKAEPIALHIIDRKAKTR